MFNKMPGRDRVSCRVLMHGDTDPYESNKAQMVITGVIEGRRCEVTLKGFFNGNGVRVDNIIHLKDHLNVRLDNLIEFLAKEEALDDSMVLRLME